MHAAPMIALPIGSRERKKQVARFSISYGDYNIFVGLAPAVFFTMALALCG